MSPLLFRGSGSGAASAFGRCCGLVLGAMALVGILAGMLTALILTLRLFWRAIVS